eukprot:9286930-Pyramimonas_sp.AAC.1
MTRRSEPCLHDQAIRTLPPLPGDPNPASTTRRSEPCLHDQTIRTLRRMRRRARRRTTLRGVSNALSPLIALGSRTRAITTVRLGEAPKSEEAALA